MSTLRRRRAAGVLIALLVVVTTALYAAWRLRAAGERGWAGFTYIPPVTKKGHQVSIGPFEPGSVILVYPGAPADRSGIARGDRILTIDGVPASKLDEIDNIARRVKRGDRVIYHLKSGGRELDRVVVLDWPLSSSFFAAVFLVTLAVALVFAVIGAFVFWRRPDDPRARVFLTMTLVATVSFIVTATGQVDTSSTRGLSGQPSSITDFTTPLIFTVAALFFAPLLLHLSLIFPKMRPVMTRHRHVVRWIYGAPLYFAGAGVLFGLIGAIPSTLKAAQITTVLKVGAIGLSVACALVVITSIVLLLRRARRTSLRDAIADRPFTTLNLGLGAVVGFFWVTAYLASKTHSVAAVGSAIFLLILASIIGFSTYPILTVISLYRSYRESGAEERRQVKWPLWGTIIAATVKIALSTLGVVLSLLAMTGRMNVPNLLVMSPDLVGRVASVLIPLSFAFAILKYRLMNIDVIIRRTVLYTILTAVVFVLYGVLVAGVGTLLIRFARVQNTTLVIASTIVVALVAVPLRNKLQQMVDRNLFRERRDYPLALRNIGNAIGGGDIDAFVRYAAEQLQHALQSRFVAIALRSDEHLVVSAKVGIADEVVGRVRIPVARVGEGVPQELRRLGAVIAVPVSVHREPLGLVASGSKLSDQEMTNDDREFLAAAASQIALGIENSRLRTEEAEFAQARAIQQVLLPTQFPRVDGFEITGRAQPARSVGGDYLDALPLGDGKIGVCIGDVAGKGMPAALLMANLQAAVKATAGPDVAPSQLCDKVKRVVGSNLAGGKFISFFYGVLDSAARTFTYSNAGHNPPILVRAGGAIERLARGGPTFCRLFRDDPHEQESVALAAGDRLVLFTDGASEARHGEEEFGEERLAELIAANRALSAADLQERIVEELTTFTSGNFSDDVTLVVVAAEEPSHE
jgi:serine phosphatase RsbU (regulator of sigma subunit)